MATITPEELRLQKEFSEARWTDVWRARDILLRIRAIRMKKSAGRPELFPTKKLIGFDDDMLARIEKWRAKQRPIPNQSDAIRELIERGLEVRK